jgi:UDP-glucose 4-epimerase
MSITREKGKPMEQMLPYTRWFITGAAGFIGSHFTERLLGEGAWVTGYDNLSLGKKEWLESALASPRFKFVHADLLDFGSLRSAMRDHDIVLHLGANTDIPRGNEDSRLDLDNCIIATYTVLEAMHAVGARNLLFASSATVYGEQWEIPLKETFGPLLPISRYGAAKLGCEALISAHCHLFDARAWIFRFGNVVGGKMGHGVIRDFISKLQQDPNELLVMGDGNQEKNYFLVEDCISGMLHALRAANDVPCGVFNLGNETSTRVSEVARIVIEEMGLRNVRIRYVGGRRGWPGDQPTIRYDASKMKQFGWQARCPSDEAVRIAARRLLGRETAAITRR